MLPHVRLARRSYEGAIERGHGSQLLLLLLRLLLLRLVMVVA